MLLSQAHGPRQPARRDPGDEHLGFDTKARRCLEQKIQDKLAF